MKLTQDQHNEKTNEITAKEQTLSRLQKRLAEEKVILETLENLVSARNDAQAKYDEAKKNTETASQSESKAKEDYDAASAALKEAKDTLAAIQEQLNDVLNGQSVWEDVKAGSDDAYVPSSEEYKELASLIKQYKDARSQVDTLTDEVSILETELEENSKAYDEAVAQLDAAKEAYAKAEQDLNDYVDSIPDEDPVVVEEGKDGVNTAVGTNMMVYVGGMILSGSLAAVYLKRRKALK